MSGCVHARKVSASSEWPIEGVGADLPVVRNADLADACQMAKPLDDSDWRILAELQADGRLSFNQLGKRVNLSAPAVAERVRRLEETGVIAGYRAEVDPAKVGMPLTAFVQLRCETGHCLLKSTTADDFPEVVEVHKLSGSFCTMLKLRATSMAHLEGLIERLGEHREMNSHVVLSTQHDHRTVVPPPEEPPTATEPEGWGRR
jgi:Lrp/AsnC family transcriptional regulator, leucine-responsive regulatory protein